LVPIVERVSKLLSVFPVLLEEAQIMGLASTVVAPGKAGKVDAMTFFHA